MSDKIISNVKLNIKWKVSTSSARPGENAGTDGYVNENLSDTLGKVVKYLNDLDSNKLDTSTVSTSGSYGTTGWSDCKLVNGKIKYYYTPAGSTSSDTKVQTSEDSSSKLYLTGTKYTGTDTDRLWKNTSVYEQSGVIYAPDFYVADVGSVKDRINILSSKGSIAITTVYDDVGLSVTLNKTGIWRIYGVMQYSNAKVTAVGLVVNGYYGISYTEVRTGFTFAGLSTSALMVDNGSHPTIKLYAQAETAANNYCAIVAEYLCSNV